MDISLPSPSKTASDQRNGSRRVQKGMRGARKTRGHGPCMDPVEIAPMSPPTRRQSSNCMPAPLLPRSPIARRSLSMSEHPPTLLPEIQLHSQSFLQYRPSSAKIGSGKLFMFEQ